MAVSRRTALVGISSTLVLLNTRAGAQLKPTSTVDIGPFYPVRRPRDEDSDLTLIKGRNRAQGQVIEVTGRVLDRSGRAVPAARVEIWQANALGRYDHPGDENPAALDPNFQGFGKLKTDRLGRFRFLSIKPGAYPDGEGSPRPPHIHVDAAGEATRIVTQMLFPNEPLNALDDVLKGYDLSRLTAAAAGKSTDGAQRFVWDIVLYNG